MSILLLVILNSKLIAMTDNYLRHTSLKNNVLKLIFKYKVKHVKYMKIKGQGVTKHVFDIQDAALPKTQNIAHYKAQGIKAFRIGQFSKKVVRVVIESRVSMRGEFKINNRSLSLFLPTEKTKRKTNSRKYVSKRVVKHKHYSYNPKRKYKTIILDAGHGGRDVGASTNVVREKDLTLSMTLKLKNILQKMGYRVLLTRDRDKFMNLKQRTDYAYNRKASILVSIHANAAPKRKTKGVRYEGLEVFYLGLRNTKRVRNKRAIYRGRKVYSKYDYKKMVSPWKFSQSKHLAISVKKNILSYVGRQYKIYDKGIKRADLWVLLATKIPAILIETGYLTNKNEVKKLTNPHYQTTLMEGVARGINHYYNIY